MPTFLHAADLHLDSPLKGLDGYPGAPADSIRGASRKALVNLVREAIDRKVDFVVIAGDVYDGDWLDYHTGLFFVHQMSLLREAHVPVFLIRGNHDAANKMTRSLKLPSNVRLLSDQKPETVHLEDLGVAIHGQGFATREVLDDLSERYPAAVRGSFNIGILHTSADGREGHDSYAPCSVKGLLNKGYDYWALGHIHTQEVLNSEPAIVFPGNVQGRHIRESGPKGCTLVRFGKGKLDLQHLILDVFRWQRCHLDATHIEHIDDLYFAFTKRLTELVDESGDRPLAVRVEIEGATSLHDELSGRCDDLRQEIRSQATQAYPDRVWVEKVLLKTHRPAAIDEQTLDGPMAILHDVLRELRKDPTERSRFAKVFADLNSILPSDLKKGSDSLDPFDDSRLLDCLADAESLLLNRLHKQASI